MGGARVEDGVLIDGDQVIAVGSPAWFAWLEQAERFWYQGDGGQGFGARRERMQRGGWYWKAYRRVAGRLRRVYLGKASDLSHERLARAAAALAGDGLQSHPSRSALVWPHTKLTPPRALHAGLIERPHLEATLFARRQLPLNLITAPAGWGKSSLLARHAANLIAAGWPVAWIALEAHDDDPIRLWSMTCMALLPFDPGMRAIEQGIRSLRAPNPQRLMTNLINRFAQHRQHPIIVIIDDAHFLTQPEIYESMIFLIEHLPSQLRLVLASRSTLALPLARWRARGMVAELRSEDLRLYEHEASLLLAAALGGPLNRPAVRAVLERTEGWAAGVHLAGLALRGTPLGHAPESTQDHASVAMINQLDGDHPYIRDYLVAEILQHEPVATQQFLLATSLLERLHPDLCAALLRVIAPDQPINPQQQLADLVQRGLFISALDREQHWFRYHSLFAEALQSVLAVRFPQLVPLLHLQAARWLQRHAGRDAGLLAAAADHAMAAGDLLLAADLLEASAAILIWERGEVKAFLRLVANIPEDLLLERPRLALDIAWAMLPTIQIDQIDQHLRKIAARHGSLVAGEAAALRTFLARIQGDLQGAIDLAKLALDLLPPGREVVRVLVLINLASVYLIAGNIYAAERVAAELQEELEQTRIPDFVAVAGVTTIDADLMIRRARPRDAERMLFAALARAERERPDSPTGVILAGIAEVRYHLNDLHDAERYARMALAQEERWWNADLLCIAYDQLGRALFAQGQIGESSQMFAHARELAMQYRVPQIAAGVRLGAAWDAFGQGDIAAAEAHLAELGTHPDAPPDPVKFDQQVLLVRVLLARGQGIAATRMAQRMAHVAAKGGFIQRQIEMLAFQALAESIAGWPESAQATLEQALRLAAPGGMARAILDAGSGIVDLLRTWIAQSDRHTPRDLLAFAHTLLPRQEQPPQRQEHPLTEREQQVFALVCDGYTNQEIATQLVVSLHTVKKHLAHIFEKLGVSSRTAAVAAMRAKAPATDRR